MSSLKDWYPERKTFREHRLKVSSIHELHIEESGNPGGPAVIWCHGGPGGGINSLAGRQFDPDFYRIVLFDQRGAGKSTPYADIRENTTRHLVSDMETIRSHLGIEAWHTVAGRSWGTTLALAYAEEHPAHVKSLFLAAVFLCDDASVKWLFERGGAGNVFSGEWEDFERLVPERRRGNIMGAYQEMLFGPDQDLAMRAAQAWSTWEGQTLSLKPDPQLVADWSKPEVGLAVARLECHYLINRGFLEEGQLLKNAHGIAHIPARIVHGRHDMNCLHDNAWRLHKALPLSRLETVAAGAHAANDPETVDAQVRAADALKVLFTPSTPAPKGSPAPRQDKKNGM